MVLTRSKLVSQSDTTASDTGHGSKAIRNGNRNFIITIAPKTRRKTQVVEDDDDPNDDHMDQDDESSDTSDMSDEEEFELPSRIAKNRVLREKANEISRYIQQRSPSLETILTAKIRKKHRAELFEWFFIYENAMPMSEERMALRRQVFSMIEHYQKEWTEYKKYKNDIKKLETYTDARLDLTNMQYLILGLETNDAQKKVLFQKYVELRERDDVDEDYYKLKSWLTEALRLPYDRIQRFPVCESIPQYLLKVKQIFDNELYGMEKVKEQLLMFIHGKIINPDMKGCCLGLVGEPGVGKCLHPMTRVLMFDGSVRVAHTLEKGDVLMGDDSTPRTILSTCQGSQLMYRVRQEQGNPYIVNSSHILTLYSVVSKTLIDIPVLEYIELPDDKKKTLYGVKTSVEFVSRTFSFPNVSPMVFGWLWASMTSGSTYSFSSPDHVLGSAPLYDRVVEQPVTEMDASRTLRETVLRVQPVAEVDASRVSLYSYKNQDPVFILRDNDMAQFLKQHLTTMPLEFKQTDRATRLLFLKGIIHAKGARDDDEKYHICLRKEIVDDVIFLLRSLGFSPIQENENSLLMDDPGLLLSEAMAGGGHERVLLPYCIQLEKLDVQPYVGFILDGNHRFLLDDFTITHNTSIARCLAKVMDFPFEQISFGGVAHADFIKGFDYTYVGSRPGEIARCVSRMGYKNGIIFFDEYEKVSQNAEIVSTLLHITDFSQNNMFRDNYFSDLIIDLSSIWFIYSMNELPTDKALRDRVYAIHVAGYSEKEKVRIVADYLLPKVLHNIQLSKSDIILSDDVAQYLVQRVSNGEKGIRTLEKAIRDVVNKISFLHTNQQQISCSFMIPSSSFPLCYPVSITRDMVDRLLKNFDVNDAPLQMYI